MDALLTAIVIWLSTNYGLPATFEHPRIERVPSIEMATLRYKNLLMSRHREVSVIQDPRKPPLRKCAMLSRFTTIKRIRFIFPINGSAVRLPNCPFSFTSWCTTFRTKPVSHLNAQQSAKSLPMKPRTNGWVCSVAIWSVSLISMALRYWFPSCAMAIGLH